MPVGIESNDQEFYDKLNREDFSKATVCDRCKKKPPVDTMRYTNYRSVCVDCRDFLINDIANQCVNE